MERRETKITREALYERVWSTPMLKLAEEFGVSDVAVAKLCKRLNVPRPGVGYWAKLAHGKAGPKPPLPRAVDGAEVEGSITGTFGEPEHPLGLRLTITPPGEDASPDLHPLVLRTVQALRRARRDCDGILVNDGGSLDIRVTSALLLRAAAIMNSLVQAWTAAGMTISIIEIEERHRASCQRRCSRSAFHSVAQFGEDAVAFRIVEVFEDKARTGEANRDRFRTAEFGPRGRLRFELGDESHPKLWKETKPGTLERRILAIASALPVALEERRDRRLRHAEWERQRQEEQRRAEIARAEESRFRALEDEALLWERSLRLGSYVAELKRAIANGCHLSENGERWLAWAESKAESLNPVARRIDALKKM